MRHGRTNPDWSTINLDKLKSLPTYKLPATYRLQDDPGNGCYGDPPGYPTYFTRSVYNQTGNTPRNAPQYVILHEGTIYTVINASTEYDKWEQILAKLWNPLPIDHPRTIAWMAASYAHLNHCYVDSEQKAEPFEYGKPATVIYPVPYYKLRTFRDDPRFSEEWRTKEQASIEQANAEIRARYTEVCTPENHAAVRKIRRYYPEHAPNLEWIENPPQSTGNWWEVLAENPGPDKCPGSMGHAHPVNGSWCQFCGWHADKAA